MELCTLAALLLAPSGAQAEGASGAAPAEATPAAPAEAAPEAAPADPAAPAEALGASESPPGPPRLTFSHVGKLSWITWPSALPRSADQVWLELEYRPRAALRLWERAKLVAEPLFRLAQAAGRYHGEVLEGTTAAPEDLTLVGRGDRQTIRLKEGYLAAVAGPVDLSAGWRIHTWGRADGVRPLDVFVSYDYTDRLREEVLGVPSAAATIGSESWTLDAVLVPVPWLNAVSYDKNNIWSLYPGDAQAVVLDRGGEPRAALENVEGGLRLSWFGQTWDLSLAAARAHERSPSFVRVGATTVAGAPALSLRPEFAAFFLAGGSVARPVGPYLARLDAAYYRFDSLPDSPLPNGVRAVAGLERRIGLADGRGALTATLQAAHDGTAPSGGVMTAFRIFKDAATASVSLDWAERYRATVRGLVDVRTGAYVATGTLAFRPTPAVSVWVGADVLGGPPDTVLGSLAGADRVLTGIDIQPEVSR